MYCELHGRINGNMEALDYVLCEPTRTITIE